MRKQINTLAILVRQNAVRIRSMEVSIYSVDLEANTEGLYWEKNGFCLWMKRLNEDKFPWPLKESSVRQITSER